MEPDLWPARKQNKICLVW